MACCKVRQRKVVRRGTSECEQDVGFVEEDKHMLRRMQALTYYTWANASYSTLIAEC